MNARHAHAEKSHSAAKAPPVRAPAASSARAPTIGNQQFQASLRTRSLLGRLADPEEAEADRLANIALRGPSCACGGTCESCKGKQEGRGHTDGPFTGGAGRALDAGTRRFFEPHFGDLSAIRIHDDTATAATARDIGASAFAYGTDIGFARGTFGPETEDGRRLLAHELAHAVRGHTGIRRQPDPQQPAPSQPTPGQSPPQQQPGQQQQPGDQPQPVAPGPLLDPTLTVDARVDAFKALVKTTAIHRLTANSQNLGAWAALVQSTVPAGDLSALALLQGGGSRAYYEMQDIRDPGLRELRAQQALGHDRACTGCHIENQLWGSRSERMRDSLTPWSSPNEMRALESLQPGDSPPAAGTTFFPQGGPGQFGPAAHGYTPPAGTAEGQVNALFPDPEQTKAATDRMRLIIAELGPEHFRVLPGDLTSTLEAGGPEAVRGQIIEAIRQRQIDYTELIGMIDDGDLGYEHFGPIISSLLPLADPEVHARITDEMDSHHFWSLVETVIVSIATVAALLLTIFPPTSALGVVALTGLEMGLAAYGIAKAPEMITVGTAYSLGTGADDVFSRQQQDAGAMMVLGGVVSLLTGPLALFRGAARLGELAEGVASSTALATTAGTAATRTVQQGDILVTAAEDGSMVITSASRPDLVIMVRGNTATLYQAMEGGGLRVIGSATVPAPVTPVTPPGAPLMLGAGETPPGALPMLPEGAPAPPEGPVIVDIQGGPASISGGPSGVVGLLPGPGQLPMLPPGPGQPPLLPPAQYLDFGDVAAQLGQLHGAGGQGVIWSVTPEGTVFATPPIKGGNIYVPQGPAPPPNFFAGPGQPKSWVLSGPLQENYTPFDVFPGEAATTRTLSQVRSAGGSNLRGLAAEQYIQQRGGGQSQVPFNLPGGLARRSDVISPSAAGAVNQEVKNYLRYIGIGGQAREVPLNSFIQSEINRDALIMYYYRQQPVWVFTDAPPSANLAAALDNARIPHVVSSDRLPTP